jgi:hypothetical protein
MASATAMTRALTASSMTSPSRSSQARSPKGTMSGPVAGVPIT